MTSLCPLWTSFSVWATTPKLSRSSLVCLRSPFSTSWQSRRSSRHSWFTRGKRCSSTLHSRSKRWSCRWCNRETSSLGSGCTTRSCFTHLKSRTTCMRVSATTRSSKTTQPDRVFLLAGPLPLIFCSILSISPGSAWTLWSMRGRSRTMVGLRSLRHREWSLTMKNSFNSRCRR